MEKKRNEIAERKGVHLCGRHPDFVTRCVILVAMDTADSGTSGPALVGVPHHWRYHLDASNGVRDPSQLLTHCLFKIKTILKQTTNLIKQKGLKERN